MIKYLLDENVDRALLNGLRQHHFEITVWLIGDPGSPPRQTPDPDILIWCEAHDFLLVTNNRSSMPVHLNDHLRTSTLTRSDICRLAGKVII
jgi:hypothetical protein